MEQLANGDNTASFEFELQEQGKYRLLFWADYVATQATKADTYTDKYYNTQDLENVMIIPEAYQLNDVLARLSMAAMILRKLLNKPYLKPKN